MSDEDLSIETIATETLRSDKIVSFFEERSGIPAEDIRHGMGDWLLPQLDMEPKDAIRLHYQETDPRATGMMQYFEKVKTMRGEDTAVGAFWNKLLTDRWLTDTQFREYFENLSGSAMKEILSADGASLLDAALKSYEGDPPDFIAELKPPDIENIQTRLENGQTVESRLEKAQKGMVEAYEMGKRLLEQGRIPVYRYLFFRTIEEKNAFTQSCETDGVYTPLNADAPLEEYSLYSIKTHSQTKDKKSPIESWTYLPPNSGRRYGQQRIGVEEAVVVVTGIDMSEVAVARVFAAGRALNVEEWNFRQGDTTQALPADTSLRSLEKTGLHACTLPTEGEIAFWAGQTYEGIVDLGP